MSMPPIGSRCSRCGSENHLSEGHTLANSAVGLKPYYEDRWSTIYHASWHEVRWAADALIADPPYGVEMGVDKDMRGGAHGLAKASYGSYQDTYAQFRGEVVPAIGAAIERVKRAAVFSGPHFQDMPPAAALGGVFCPAGSGRHSWGFKTFLPILFYGVEPRLQAGQGGRSNVLTSTAVAEPNGHPCPKPLSWMTWLVDLASVEGETIVDPFMGSGTTLVAAKQLGRKAIGIEIEERYCEIAAKRLAQEVLPFSAIRPKNLITQALI